VTKVVCTSCGEVHKGPFQQRDFTDADWNCSCGGRRVLPSQAKPRKGLKPKSAKRQAAEESGARPKQRRRSGLKQGRGFQASPEQQAKVKGLVCVSCKRDYYEEGAEIQAAHVYPRRLAKCECAEGVVPLCSTCHRCYDDLDQVFDLMPALITAGYRAEIVHAFVHHDAPMGEVLRIIGGTEWKSAEGASVAA
jgi:hypothetical protein